MLFFGKRREKWYLQTTYKENYNKDEFKTSQVSTLSLNLLFVQAPILIDARDTNVQMKEHITTSKLANTRKLYKDSCHQLRQANLHWVLAGLNINIRRLTKFYAALVWIVFWALFFTSLSHKIIRFCWRDRDPMTIEPNTA